MQANQFFCSISKDLVFYIRSFLIVDPGSLKKCLEFDDTDGKRSWNNFLCVSRRADWTRLRKEGISICLNSFNSKRYLLEEEFRKKILTMMDNPYLQLSILVADFEDLTDEMGELLSNCYRIYFGNYRGVSLPVIHHVYHVVFCFCSELQDCRGLRDIQSLEMLYSNEQFNVKMRKECLESLTTLKLTGTITLFPDMRLPRLKRLGITPNIPFPMDQCPNLEEFRLFEFDSYLSEDEDMNEDEQEEDNVHLVHYNPDNNEEEDDDDDDEFDDGSDDVDEENEESEEEDKNEDNEDVDSEEEDEIEDENNEDEEDHIDDKERNGEENEKEVVESVDNDGTRDDDDDDEDDGEYVAENEPDHELEDVKGPREKSEETLDNIDPTNLSILPLPVVHSRSLKYFDAYKSSIHLSSFPFHQFSQLKIILIDNPSVESFRSRMMIEKAQQFQSTFLRELSSLSNLIELEFSNAIVPIPSKLLFKDDGKPLKIRSITLNACKFIDRTFYLTENIRSMEFNDSDIKEIIPSPNHCHRYAMASFVNCENLSPSFISSSILKNSSKVILDRNSFLTDISSLEQVPYLSLNYCLNINTFHVLGKYQIYLSISGNRYLTNEHLLSLANVRELHISNCPGITDISMLTNNLYLYIRYLENLSLAEIYGKDYCVFNLQRCCSLEEIIVHGKVHLLRMDDDPSIVISEDSKRRITVIELT